MFALDWLDGCELWNVVVELLDDGVVAMLPDVFKEPEALALPLALPEALMEPEFIEPELFWLENVLEDGCVAVVVVLEELGEVDCIELLEPSWLPDCDEDVGAWLENELEFEEAEEPEEGGVCVAPEALDVWACRPRAAAKRAVAPQVISLLVFFIVWCFEG